MQLRIILELDYKSSTEFLVGMYINYPQDVVKSELVWVTSKQDWNKIYLNLTQTGDTNQSYSLTQTCNTVGGCSVSVTQGN